MNRSYLCLLTLGVSVLHTHAQDPVFKVLSGTPMVITANTVVSAGGLVLTPSADFSLEGNSLSRNPAITNTKPFVSVSRGYKFGSTSAPFTGTVRVAYAEGELNSIPEATLSMLAYNGSLWNSYTPATRDGVNNSVQTSSLSALTLNELTLSDATTWKGTSEGSWNNASNWTDGIPSGSINVLINTAGPQMDLDHSVDGGKVLALNGTGTLIVNAGRTLSVKATGTADFGGKSVTFKSDATGTAQLGNVAGILQNATNVTVERFIPATGRRYRLLAPSVTTSGSIRNNWMESGLNTLTGSNNNPSPAYGIQITGAGGNINGFDVTTSNDASLYATTNGTSLAYNAFSNTTPPLHALTGYFVFIRGDRSQNMALANTNIAPTPVPLPSGTTTLRATGTLLQGTQTSFTNPLLSTNGAMNLITNPFAAVIDWSLIYPAASNIHSYYTFWDPNIGFRGGFVTVTDNGVTSAGAATNIIQPGQAFFVTSNGNGTPAISIQEAHKASKGMSNEVFATTTTHTGQLSLSLHYHEANGNRRIADGVKVVFGNDYKKDLDGHDALEIANWDENLAISRNGKRLAIESRPSINGTDTIPLLTGNMKKMNYELEVEPARFSNHLLRASLEDRFTGISRMIDLKKTSVVPFSINNDPASAATNRFEIVFSTVAAQPVQFISFKGQPQGSHILLNWSVRAERDVLHYVVEKSIDGIQYEQIARQTTMDVSKPYNNYRSLDADPRPGTSYYRIRPVSVDGLVAFSDVVRVDLGNNGADVQAYPNPVQGGRINLQLHQLPADSYRIEWYNPQGQLLKKNTLSHPGGFYLHQLDVPSQQGTLYWKLSKGNRSWNGTVIKGQL